MQRNSEPTEGQLDEAALWHAKRAGGSMSAAEERQFQDWLNADRCHRLAFDRMRVLWGQLEMPARRLAGRRRGSTLAGMQVWFGAKRAAVLATGLAAALALTWYVKPSLMQDLRATVISGPQMVSDLTLPDGSVARLAANTALRLDFDDGRRQVELLRGQAFFEVVHLQSGQGFMVSTADAVVEVVGTRFDVDRLAPRTVVTVEEGAVRVTPSDGTQSALLRPGHQVLAADGQLQEQASADVSAVLSWMTGRLNVRNLPVGEVVEKLQTLAGHRILVLGGLSDRPISGSFPTTDIAGSLETIAQAVQGRVVQTGPWLTILY